MTSFDDALKVWAKKYLEENARISTVDIITVSVRYVNESGYCETCYDPAHLDIDITYENDAGVQKDFWDYEYSSVRISEFELLQQLFK